MMNDRNLAPLYALTITPEALHALGVIPTGRNGIYEACNRGEIECFRIGKKIVIPTAPLRKKLGMAEAT